MSDNKQKKGLALLAEAAREASNVGCHSLLNSFQQHRQAASEFYNEKAKVDLASAQQFLSISKIFSDAANFYEELVQTGRNTTPQEDSIINLYEYATGVLSNDMLEDTHRDVVVFEQKVRAALRNQLAALIPAEKAEDIISRGLDLLFAETPEQKIAYIQLLDEVFTAVAPKYPIRDLHILWPTDGMTKEKAKLLSEHGCDSLAAIAEQAAIRFNVSRTSPNTFKL